MADIPAVEFNSLALKGVQGGTSSSKWGDLRTLLIAQLDLPSDANIGFKAVGEVGEIGNRYGEALFKFFDYLFVFVPAGLTGKAVEEAHKNVIPNRLSLVAVCAVDPSTRLWTVREIVAMGDGLELARRLARLFPGAIAPAVGGWNLRSDPQTVADVRGSLQFAEGVVEQCLSALSSGHHLLLAGPPGTGKSTLAESVCVAAYRAGVTSGHVLGTATADWTTFEVIGGYFPTADGKGLGFHEGVVTSAIASNQWAVIDEINRANVDRAVGPLITLLSGSASRVAVQLPQLDSRDRPYGMIRDPAVARSYRSSDGDWIMGANWRLVATMNSFDRNALFPLTAAFSRRFATVFVGIPPVAAFLESLGVGTDTRAHGLFSVVMTEDLEDPKWTNPRPLGPAIVKDAWTYAESRSEARPPDTAAVLEGLALFALPQYVGLRPADWDALRKRLADECFDTDAVDKQLAALLRGLEGH